MRYFTLFPRRYRIPQDAPTTIKERREYWGRVSREYGNMQKKIACYDLPWRVITYKDGHKELAYLKVRQNGLLSGRYPAIYRGVIIPRMMSYIQFANIESIRIAF